MPFLRHLALLVTALLFSACDKQGDSLLDEPRGDCNPLGAETHCMLPFPSSFYLEEDADSATGYRVAFGETTLPISDEDLQTEPTYYNEKDGFPTLGSLYVLFPDISLDNVLSHQDLGAYLDEDVTTVILDAETGERVPHFVELDDRIGVDDRKVLMLRPARPMEHATRYVVGIRGLVDSTGAPFEPPAAFQSLRDGSETDDADIERQRQHYEEVIFPALEADGFSRDELLLAWDFVTVSKEDTVGRALFMRDDALSRLPAGGPTYTIDTVSDEDCAVDDPPEIGRTLKGTFTAPSYLTDWEPGSVLTRDEDGMPYYNGDVEVPFSIRVPCSLILDPHPGTLVQYGHGLLGDQTELYTSYLREMAAEYDWVMFSVDWTGMKSVDVPAIMTMLAEGLTDFAIIPERTLQGYVEFMLAGRMMLGDMANDEHLVYDGQSLVDTSHLYYYGNSQGSILGGGYVAFSPDIERAVFGVGGTPYSLLLTRSHDFDIYLILLEARYSDQVDISLFIGLMQLLWDPGEAAGWAHFMNETPVDDSTPTKQVLLQTAIGDAQVPTLAGQNLARAYGASLVDPPTRDVWGLDTQTAPFEGSALVEFDFGVEEPTNCVPSDDETDTHEDARRVVVGQDQIRTFLEEGIVEQYCDGPCDPD